VLDPPRDTRRRGDPQRHPEHHYVLNSTATFHTEPLTLEERFAWRTNRTSAHPVTVAPAEGRIVGWGALELFRSRRAYRHTA